jgi:alkanesulfonate monooxygenase SsuD/methylene tetrahydromethanopterin reductase-like flavin-dependent oxidoreductase (luciferase family)
VKFGIFYEHQLPRPWGPDDEHRMMKNALEQVELADRLGIDYVWEVEHHFLDEYSHSSAPEVFLAAASQRTSRIRLGHGIIPLPVPYNHPARVAERVATLDLVSDGRVEFGTGETSSEAELGGFGVPRETKRAQWEEALDAITRMMVEEPFAGYDGTYVKMPVRNVVPKPLQKPHPPLWVACGRKETIHVAATKGIGALSFAFISDEEAKGWVDDYYATLASEACVPGGFAVNPNIAVVLPLMCHRDEQTAIDRGLDGGHFMFFSLLHHYVFGRHQPGRTDVWKEFEEKRHLFGFDRSIASTTGQPLGIRFFDGQKDSVRGAVGTPDQIRGLLQAYADAGVDQIMFIAQAGKNRHEDVCESLELFAKEVLPDFAEREDEREAAKAERLVPAIEAALARKEPPRTAPGDYEIVAAAQP